MKAVIRLSGRINEGPRRCNVRPNDTTRSKLAMPLYSGICPVCSTPFERQSRVRAKYCSEVCMEKGRRRRPRQERIPGREAICIVCQRRFIHHQGIRNQVVCSRRCSSDGRSALLALAHRLTPPHSVEIMCPLNRRSCVECGDEWIAAGRVGGAKRCSGCTAQRARTEGLRHYYEIRRPRDGYGQRLNTCTTCGADFVGQGRKNRAYCSKVCAMAKRRSLVVVEAFAPSEIYKRDAYRCAICIRPLAMAKAVPHPDAPTIDHILPVAEGGVHSRSQREGSALHVQFSTQ